jgi:hypothetical protein
MNDPLKPALPLLVKLGSLAVHIEEMLSPAGHEYDRAAIDTLLTDPEVTTWMAAMGKMGFLPVKR